MSRARWIAAAGVIALTLAVSTVARADDPPAVAPAHTGTPLNVRAGRALSLAPNSPAGATGAWKLVALLGVLGGAAWYWKRNLRGATGATATAARPLAVLRRVSIGVRSELMIVEADGQRLLLGVTPQSVTSLAILGDVLADVAPVREDKPEATAGSVGDRFAAMLAAARSNAPAEAPVREPAPVIAREPVAPRAAPRRIAAASPAPVRKTVEAVAPAPSPSPRRRTGPRGRTPANANALEEQARGILSAIGGSR